ncbi:uncharacterized protein B0H18DRAFT_1118162 [Fomitopsis serialis]|uniref:uncharacterized protein n=1 Tax=Fomitopsis serialis TaxID=139415 RepID=UPI00200859F1|nr:uncharacterized protein B0H18DRAFT_1118162 [Neoantrodia serialis]KAH9928144.1 hypothetical protein B0H18DRAFT_1118162 [Neoantrodia serialis]
MPHFARNSVSQDIRRFAWCYYYTVLTTHRPGWKFYLTFAICGFTNTNFFWGTPSRRAEAELCERKVHVSGGPVDKIDKEEIET